jgi:hypothetical protein
MENIKFIARLGIVAVILTAASPIFGRSNEQFAGTWGLDYGKSDFKLVAPPQNVTITIAPIANGISQAEKVMNGNGATNEVDYTLKFDGKQYTAPPESRLNQFTTTRADADTIVRTGFIHGKQVETTTYKLTNNGRSLTINTVATDNPRLSATVVYDREPTVVSRK